MSNEKKTFTIPKINGKNREERKSRFELLAKLFAEFGMQEPSFFSNEMDMTTVSFRENNVKVVYTITGLLKNTYLNIHPTDYDVTIAITIPVSAPQDFEYIKAKMMKYYRLMLDKKGAAIKDEQAIKAILDKVAPYAKQITMTAHKFGYEAKIEERPEAFDVALLENGERKATLRFNSNLRFESVVINNEHTSINGFDYGLYEAKIAEMKNIEALQVELSNQLSCPPVTAKAEAQIEEA